MLDIFRKNPSKLDDPIDRLLQAIAKEDQESAEYDKLTKQLDRLMKLQAEEPRGGVSPETIVNVAGSIAGILIIVAYEHSHVMVSKALGRVIRTN